MKFSYTALTGDNKKMTGVLDTVSLEAAQAELHKMGVAIIAVNEITEEEFERMKTEQAAVSVAKGIQTFTFLALDPNSKEVEGTIDSADDYSAYKRLRTEYKFKINDLYPSNATDDQKQLAKGVLEGFESRLESELAETKSKESKSDENAEGETSHELIAEIDNIIINTKSLLESKSDLFSNTLLREINDTLGELERVRTSNNVKHITEISNNLYELISNPDKTNGNVSDVAFKSMLTKLQDSALVKKEFDLYKKAIQSTGMKKIFKSIADKLKSMTASKEDDATKQSNVIKKAKNRLHKFLEKLTAKKAPERKKPKSAFAILIETLTSYLKASSPVLKKARKKEFVKALKTLFKKDKKDEIQKTEEKALIPEVQKSSAGTSKAGVSEKTAINGESEIRAEDTKKKGRDFTSFFVEIDSFFSWLLSFYIIYFFLVNFSLEKNIGLNKEFVFRTLKSPLILNITIFLLIFHYALRLKNLHFRHNFFASLFLIFLSLGIYAILIINF